ncbi:MAG: hypothetical protein WAV56_03705 [Microgenomates group bacterium]
MARIEGEILRKRPVLLALANFTRDLSEYVAAIDRTGGSININLVTYNRVGEGLLGGFAFTKNATLNLYQGKLGDYLSSERGAELAFGGGEGKIPSLNLTSEEVAEFFKQAKIDLIRQVIVSDQPILFVVYGGEEEKFRMVLDLINDVSNLARGLGREGLHKFYLLTCNCDLARKTREAQSLYSEGRLDCVIYNPAGACGGFEDLQTIAETVLNAVPEKE